MTIFPTSFAFSFWNKTLNDCRVFQARKKEARKPRKYSLFTPVVHLIRSNYYLMLVCLHRGSGLCCVNCLVKI